MNVAGFLEALDFRSDNNTLYQKEYKLHNYIIKADISKGKILYRTDDQITVERQTDKQIQLGDKTTSNFSQPENFVVLECVDRLLRKGYNPNDIHLERRYPLGRGASGGKSDVCVYGKDGKSLLVIECKTWGEEFEKEKKKMDEHGGQLFAYLANDQNAKFLVLYASQIKTSIGGLGAVYENLIIQVKDREEDLKKSTKQVDEGNLKLYENAKNKAEFFEVWKESFNKYVHFNGIFDEDANAYSLELKALKKKNLKSLEDASGLFNKFAEILRHNNISDNANAFNKILSLFLCKIVDEEKNEDDVLDFQVKEDEEYEHIIDRLQALYQKGMKKLNEEIVYFPDDVITNLISLYPRQTPLEQLKDVFTQLKYYTNNDFAFKEVHNKKLFEQNGRVLNEIIKLLQNFRFRFTSKQQVLGDFFELMLNHGVKQSEGQFFTPIPIVRYMILSLGFEKIIEQKISENKEFILPKILDYACGAGHFLTESVEELQHNIKQIDASKLSTEQQKLIESYKENTFWAKNYIFGIEKDYRLARASQIACYINGDGDANIIFGDGLEEHEKLNLNKHKFDLVVANPPYSVKAFKNYLNVGRANFELFDSLTEASNEIETVFIERTKQLLTYNGLAGLVLPTSIFESGGIYVKARELLFKHFEIKGITELGSKTFIATNVKTAIVFLKRRDDTFLKDREYIASDLFTNTKYAINLRYIDANVFLKMFCEHRGFDLEDYQRFLIIEINEALATNKMFVEYQSAFENSTEIKQLKAKTFFKNYTVIEQNKELHRRFYFYCKIIEQQKFLYFMLCLGDGQKNIETVESYYKPQQTIIVKTGKEIDEQKEFLGYEFSTREGQEGIKINNYGGKMFDAENNFNPKKANYYVRKAILNEEITSIDAEISKNIQVISLIDLINFEQIDFDKKVSTETISKTNWEDIWQSNDIFTLSSDLVEIQKGSSITKAKTSAGEIPVVAGGQQPAYFHSVANRPKNIITVSASGAYAGFLNFWNTEIFASDCTTIKSADEDKISTELLYQILKVIQPEIYKLQRGQAQPHVYPRDIEKIKIPIPSVVNQKIIIEALAELDNDKGKYLTNGIAVKDLDGLLQTERKKIIVKYSFQK